MASSNQWETIQQLAKTAPLSANHLKKAQEIVQQCGALELVQNEAEKAIQKSHKILLNFPDNHYRDLLLKLSNYITTRNK
jgi:geranylgeranyl pyrophosphate synthase